jgi:hypothetical protein
VQANGQFTRGATYGIVKQDFDNFVRIDHNKKMALSKFLRATNVLCADG